MGDEGDIQVPPIRRRGLQPGPRGSGDEWSGVLQNALTASPPLSGAREEPRRHRVWSGEVARRKDTFLFRLFAAGFSYGDDRDDSAIAPPRVFPTGCAHSQISVANGRRCGDGIRR